MNHDWLSRFCLKKNPKSSQKNYFTALSFSEDGVSAHKIIYVHVYIVIEGLNLTFVIAVEQINFSRLQF